MSHLCIFLLSPHVVSLCVLSKCALGSTGLPRLLSGSRDQKGWGLIQNGGSVNISNLCLVPLLQRSLRRIPEFFFPQLLAKSSPLLVLFCSGFGNKPFRTVGYLSEQTYVCTSFHGEGSICSSAVPTRYICVWVHFCSPPVVLLYSTRACSSPSGLNQDVCSLHVSVFQRSPDIKNAF